MFIETWSPNGPSKLRRSGMDRSGLNTFHRRPQIRVMPLLRSLGGSNAVRFYKHGAPNGAWPNGTPDALS